MPGMSTSKCFSCYYSCLCTTQPLVRQARSQDWAEQVAERRPFCPPWNRHRHHRPAPTGKVNLRGTPHSQVKSCSLHGCRLLHFTISSSISSLRVSHSPSLLFLPATWVWASLSPSFRLWSAGMLAFCAIQLFTAFVSSHLNNTY